MRPGFAGHEEAFPSLGGGAREQVVAAVRPAIAELLAGPYSGMGPVVFDDAFADADPGHVDRVMDVLYQAGRDGPQVTAAAYDPERYRNARRVQRTMNRWTSAYEA